MRAVPAKLGRIRYLQQYNQHLPLAVLVDWRKKKNKQAMKQVKNISSE